MYKTTLGETLFAAKKDKYAMILCWLSGLLLLVAFCVPVKKLTDTFGTGHRGSNNAMTANISISYHKAPLKIASLIPALYREKGKDALQKDMYFSHFPAIYLYYAAITSITGVSESSIRLIAISFCILAVLTLGFLLRKNADWQAFMGIFLFITSPLTLLYGNMAEHYLPIGVCLLIGTWGFGRYINGKMKLLIFILMTLPLAISSSFMYVYFVVAVFASILIIEKSFKKAVITGSILTLIWAAFFGSHLYTVYAAADTIDPFFARSTARGIIAAFTTQDNPINDIVRSFTERLGIPITVLMILSAYTAIKNRKIKKQYYAITLVAIITSAGFIITFMQLVAVHRYALQLFLPLFCYISARSIVKLLSEDRSRFNIAVGLILLLACTGLFIHRLNRWSFSDKYESALAEAGREAATNSPDNKVMMLVDKNVMGAWMNVQYYSEKPVYRKLVSELDESNPNDYSAMIGTNVNPLIPVLCEKFKLSQDDFQIKKDKKGKPLGIFLWINPHKTKTDN